MRLKGALVYERMFLLVNQNHWFQGTWFAASGHISMSAWECSNSQELWLASAAVPLFCGAKDETMTDGGLRLSALPDHLKERS